MSAKDAHALLKKAQRERARVILVGDIRQLSAVEAGNPFKSLQNAGIQTAYLEESRRQKTEALRAAVVCLSAGQQREGLERLDMAQMVKEIADGQERQRQVVNEYMQLSPEARKKTLILSGTNVERLALTADLRKALQAEGSLGADAYQLRSLRALDRTQPQLKYACVYAEGEVVVPVRDYRRYGLKKDGQYTIISTDIENNQITVAAADGSVINFDPSKCADKTTYAVQEIAISKGDQLRWTRNDKSQGIRNGQLVTVEAIDAKGNATLRDAKGEVSTVALSGQQYLDYALVSTTYSSQGKTADQVLVAIDSTISKEGLYVAVSRAKQKLSLYTADKQTLFKQAERSATKENPSDYLTLFNLVNPDAENEKAADPARALRSADQSEHLGDRAGRRVALSHRAAIRRDRAVEGRGPRSQSAAVALYRSTGQVTSSVSQLSHSSASAQRQSERAATEASGQLAAVVREQQQRVAQERKRRRRREVYQQCAAKFAGVGDRECDLLVAHRLMSELLTKRSGKRLKETEVRKVGNVLLQGPVAQQLKRTQGKEAGIQYAAKVLTKAQKVVEKEQRQSRGQGMEM